jgi:hypothetical protein
VFTLGLQHFKRGGKAASSLTPGLMKSLNRVKRVLQSFSERKMKLLMSDLYFGFIFRSLVKSGDLKDFMENEPQMLEHLEEYTKTLKDMLLGKFKE